jgi:hypothetical protein
MENCLFFNFSQSLYLLYKSFCFYRQSAANFLKSCRKRFEICTGRASVVPRFFNIKVVVFAKSQTGILAIHVPAIFDSISTRISPKAAKRRKSSRKWFDVAPSASTNRVQVRKLKRVARKKATLFFDFQFYF